MGNDLISVIVPIYNVEKYLEKCINSIIEQTYQNIEIVLVDDGSSDNSGKICDEYASKDKRVKAMHKKNGGVSDARNFGVENANGKYIAFIDSDDYITNDYIEYLYRILKENNAEISCCNFEYVYSDKENKEIESQQEKLYTYNQLEALKDLLYQKNIDTSLWGKLIKKDLFNNIKFPYGEIYEDFAVFYKVLLKIEKIVYSNVKKYFYMQREKSILSTNFGKKDLYMVTAAEEMYNTISKQYPELESALNSRIINMDFYLLRRISKKENKQEYLNLKNDVKARRKIVVKDKNTKLKTKIAIYISYIDIRLVKYFYYIAKKMSFFGISNYLTKYKK